MNFAMKDRFCLNLLLSYSRTRFNFLLLKGIILTILKLLANCSTRGTEKFDDYRNARCHNYCYYGNGEHWCRNKYNSNFDAWT